MLPNNIEATWAGIEVMGTDKETAQKIRNLIPIKIGDTFQFSESEKYRLMCYNLMKDNFQINNVHCGFIFFGGGHVYLDVEILNNKSIFRSIPKIQATIPTISNEFINLLNQWDQRVTFLITNKQPIIEIYDKGYLDSKDPILHALAEKLAPLAYKHNNLLLDIVRYSPDVDSRTQAATLLSWARHQEQNLRFVLKWDLLNDPDKGVRNNLARAFSSIMHEVKDVNLLSKLIPVYCKQATLPSHTDRNKALYSIMGILKQHSNLSSEIDCDCKNTINNISEISTLENVGGLAKEILRLMETSSSHG